MGWAWSDDDGVRLKWRTSLTHLVESFRRMEGEVGKESWERWEGCNIVQ